MTIKFRRKYGNEDVGKYCYPNRTIDRNNKDKNKQTQKAVHVLETTSLENVQWPSKYKRRERACMRIRAVKDTLSSFVSCVIPHLRGHETSVIESEDCNGILRIAYVLHPPTPELKRKERALAFLSKCFC